jgi:uncharacterized protein YmfQ (DUF2313 family)
MASRLYLHDAGHGLTGSFPSGEQDSQGATFTAAGANTLRAMDGGIGAPWAMTYLSATTSATTSPQSGFMGMWVSSPLSVSQTLGGGSETLTVNVADYESDLAANHCINRVHAYVWRPSAGIKVGDLCTYATFPSGYPEEPAAANSIQITEFSVALAEVAADVGDVVIIELWSSITQFSAASYTVRVYYGGAIESDIEGDVVIDHASYVEFSQTLLFEPPEAQLLNQSVSPYFESTVIPEAQLLNQGAVAYFESTGTTEVQLIRHSVIVWYVEADSLTSTISDLKHQSSAAPITQINRLTADPDALLHQSLSPDSLTHRSTAAPIEQVHHLGQSTSVLRHASTARVPEVIGTNDATVANRFTAESYTAQLISLLPRGLAWPTRLDTVLWKLLRAIAEELARIHARLERLAWEADPRSTIELLPDWERVAGLPDACVNGTSLNERRAAVSAKITNVGGQSRQFYIDLAKRLGYSITITEASKFTVQSRVNDPLSGAMWAYVWQVNAPIATIRRFTVGSYVNDPLASWGNETLECAIRRLKPAHTLVQFAYT